ncbi:acetylcholinesterase-like [Asterias rubens]|uniref:acetylcholinesterase-like n=1 Tax=Asterias rubens TaxID=7604 RepID=UPI001455AC0E|nr:acetylcholinesterase-like [Asterias rubens]
MTSFRKIFIPDGFEEYVDGAPHGLDVLYVFGLVAAFPLPTPAQKLSSAMIKYWSNFAKTGDPNDSDLLTWPQWDPTNEQYIALDKKISTGQHLLTGRINFWLDYIHKLIQPVDPHVCPLNVPVRSVESHQASTKITQIQTDKGVVLGRVLGSLKKADPAMGGQEVAEYLGVPYAEPPLGRLRFRPAGEGLPWEGLLNGTVRPPACPQTLGSEPWMVDSGFVEMSEDCLTLNVYSPTTSPRDQHLPVVVYVHHGLGIYGTASVYEATTLSSKSNTVIVVINYRLGALGFLSTEDEQAPGNAGLHDILVALGWVQKYIGSFGGDVNRVTLAGYGSGASLVHALMASRKSNGLLHQCILMGGSVFDPMMSNTVQMGPAEQAATLATKLGCPTNTHAAMIQCLQQQPVADLVTNKPLLPLTTAFRPVVDGDILSDAPIKLIRAGQITSGVDCIIGSNEHWMDYQVAELLPSDLQSCPSKLELTTLVNNTIKMFFHHNSDLVSQAVLNEYVDEYVSSGSFCPQRQQLRWFMQDFLSTVPIMEAAQYHSMANNAVYLYSFNHNPKYHYSSLPTWTGTSLGDDLQYLFGFPYWPAAVSYPLTSVPSYRLTDKKTTLEWTSLLSSFIHNG